MFFRLYCSTSCNLIWLPKLHVSSRDIDLATDCSVGAWLSPFRGYSKLDEMWELPSLIFFLRISTAVFIRDWDKTENSASKHLLAYCGMPEQQRSPARTTRVWMYVRTHICVCAFQKHLSISMIGTLTTTNPLCWQCKYVHWHESLLLISHTLNTFCRKTMVEKLM